MLFKPQSQTITLPDGNIITLETGKLARLAHGSVLLTQGKTKLLATVVIEKQTEKQNFLPLSVDYQEKYAAAGKIPGSFLKRESRLTEHEILISRLVDRAIRPCFPKNYFDKIQVQINLFSYDSTVSPGSLAALAASTALMLSPAPFYQPISEVCVARIEGKLYINPNPALLPQADLNIIVAAAEDRILMVEGEMNEITEEDLLEAVEFGHNEIKKHCQAQQTLATQVGTTKQPIPHLEDNPIYATYHTAFYQPAYQIASQALPSQEARKNAFKKLRDDYITQLEEPLTEETQQELKEYFGIIKNEAIRDLAIKENSRIDGRKSTDIRPIDIETDILPSAHGSATFTRGETQVLTSLTLGSKDDEQLIDGVTKNGYNKIMNHYDFPSFSTGEVKPNRGSSRREIGHGNLVGRALKSLIPSHEENPYTIRLHHTTLSSNGSSSMAATCAGSLALMDAGIKIPKTIGGIAMGLISDTNTNTHVILSDILGEEDKIGDMDFKITGTKDGLTACQMDIKISGISHEILKKALQQAKQGLHHIIGEMEKNIQEARKEFKPHTPRIKTIKISRDIIGSVIGPGGKVIQEIQRKSGTTVSVSDENGIGIIYILAPDKSSLENATQIIQGIIAGPEIGLTYHGKVKSIQKYGAFIEFISGIDGLLHISQISDDPMTEDELKERLPIGEKIYVKLAQIKNGRYSLALSTENTD